MRIFNKLNIFHMVAAVFGCMAPVFAQTLSWSEYALPNPPGNGSVLGSIVDGPDGAVWFAIGDSIGRISTAGSVTYPAIGSTYTINYDSLVLGADGAFWFVANTSIVRVSTDGTFTNYLLPTGSGTLAQPVGITSGPDGALWFACVGGGTTGGGGIGRLTTSGTFTEYPFPSGMSGAQRITTGPDGALWFTMGNGGNNQAIGRVTTAGSFTSWPFTSITGGNTQLGAITAGSDGALWFVVTTTESIGRITTAGVITQFKMMTFSNGGNSLITMISGPDGALWLTGGGTQILRVTTSQQQTVFSDPSDSAAEGLTHIAVGPDSALWLTGEGQGPNGTIAQKIFRIGLTQAGATPTVTAVLNNYSYSQPGYPNSGVSPSTLFIIQGTGLATATSGPVSLQSTASPGLPTTLNGATVSVTVGGTTVTPGLYYALPTQLAAVLPANTPAGTASVTVSLNGTPSAAFQFQVVSAAPGLDTYYGTGGGMITATDAVTGALINFTSSAAPGETIVLWGSGLGADTADSDTVFTSSPHAVNQASTQIYIGNIPATVLYAGSSGYPGLTQINVTIPANVPTGCRVSIVAVVAGVASNFALLPISPGGGVCSDPTFNYNGTQLASSLTSTVTTGTALIQQLENSNTASVTFTSDVDGNAYTSIGILSVGGCIVTQGTGPAQSGGTLTYLSAGTVSLKGPSNTYALTSQTSTTPDSAELPAGAIPASGGTFVFTATGSSQVGPFSVTVNLAPLMTWTNSSAAATVNRAAGLQINWSGGQPSSYMQIYGQSVSSNPSINAMFNCYVPQSAGTFTVPSYVLSALPAGSGNVVVENFTAYVPFLVSGVQYPYSQGGNSISTSSKYQ